MRFIVLLAFLAPLHCSEAQPANLSWTSVPALKTAGEAVETAQINYIHAVLSWAKSQKEVTVKPLPKDAKQSEREAFDAAVAFNSSLNQRDSIERDLAKAEKNKAIGNFGERADSLIASCNGMVLRVLTARAKIDHVGN